MTPKSIAAFLRRLFFENLTQKIFALALAVTLVVFVREDKPGMVTASVRVRVSHPVDRVLVSPLIDKVSVTIEGKYSNIRKFDAEQVPPLDLNLSGFEGEQVAFEPENFKLPPGLVVRSVRPAAMVVRFEEKRQKKVPVVARTEGEPADGYRLSQITVEPPEVVVEGAASVVDALTRAETVPIQVAGRSQTAQLPVQLRGAPAYTVYLGPEAYDVTLTIEEKQGTRVVTNRPVRVRTEVDGPPEYEVSPATVDITLHGPVRVLDALEVESLVAYVDARDSDPSKRVLHTRPLVFEPPAGLSLVELKPAKVTLVRMPELKPEAPPEAPAPPEKRAPGRP